MSDTSQFDRLKKRLSQNIQRIGAMPVVLSSIEMLHRFDDRTSSQELKTNRPWTLMWLIRLAFTYGSVEQSYQAIADWKLRRDIFLPLGQLEGVKNHITKDRSGIHMFNAFMRMMSFQQLPWQFQESLNNLAREILLLSDFQFNNRLDNVFRQRAGCSIIEFLVTTDVIATLTRKGRNLSTLLNRSRLEYVRHVPDILSLKPPQIKDALENYPMPITSAYLQMFERTPFIFHPLLELDNQQYLAYSARLVEMTVESYVYDTLRATEPELLGNELGTRLEWYARQGLNLTQLLYLDPPQLKNALANSKTVDYFVHLDDITLLVECKAASLRPPAQVNPIDTLMKDNLRNNVVKAIAQAYETIHSLRSRPHGIPFDESKPVFLIILTYRPLYVGPVSLAWVEFLEEAVAQFVDFSVIDKSIINVDRVLIMDVAEWDFLVNLVINGSLSIETILQGWEKHQTDNYLNIFQIFHTPQQYLDTYNEKVTKYDLPYLSRALVKVTEDTNRILSSLI